MIDSWSRLGPPYVNRTRGGGAVVGGSLLVVGTHSATRTPPSRAQFWARIDHIFATVARIDKLIGYSERGRRTTSEYTIYLIKLARPKKSSELFEIFGKKSWKLFLIFQNFFKIFKNFRNFFENFFQLFSQLFFKNILKKVQNFFLVAPNLSSK